MLEQKKELLYPRRRAGSVVGGTKIGWSLNTIVEGFQSDEWHERSCG